MSGILMFAELDRGHLTSISFELAAKGRELGELTAVALGPGAKAAGEELFAHGARKVLVNESADYDGFLAEPQAHALAALVRRDAPDLILFGFTPDGRDVAGRLAAQLRVGAISNAVDIMPCQGEENAFLVRVSYAGGGLQATYRTNARPAIVLFRPRCCAPSRVASSANQVETRVVEHLPHAIGDAQRRARIVVRNLQSSGRVPLDDAEIVVSGGRGLGRAENYRLVEDLAQALGGAAGASRAIVDLGWATYAQQIGQTGKTVQPRVYFAVGISGATQHVVGMKASRLIVAINTDASAPIFEVADVGVVGDAMQIMPRLIDAVLAAKAAPPPRASE